MLYYILLAIALCLIVFVVFITIMDVSKLNSVFTDFKGNILVSFAAVIILCFNTWLHSTPDYDYTIDLKMNRIIVVDDQGRSTVVEHGHLEEFFLKDNL